MLYKELCHYFSLKLTEKKSAVIPCNFIEEAKLADNPLASPPFYFNFIFSLEMYVCLHIDIGDKLTVLTDLAFLV